MTKPLIAITMGDPTGVGPEVIAGAWTSDQFHACCRPLVVGRPEVMRRAVQLRGAATRVIEISSPQQAPGDPAVMPCLCAGSPSANDAPAGQIDRRGGQAAYDAVLLAAQLALAGQVDGITTAPLSKAALWAAGHHYPGHTELLAELCGGSEAAMMLYVPPARQARGGGGLGVVHVTLHCALRDVFRQLTRPAIVSKVRLADAVMRAFIETDGPVSIGVAALNPHAGEDGLFGDEEQLIIRPAVEQAKAAGFQAQGPFPADTLLARAVQGEFDAVVAMYHDQGHIAVKLLAMHQAVNITLGLSIVRTSVAHGTAFDRAWTGQAECCGMTCAVSAAAQLIERRVCTRWNADLAAS